MKLFVSKKEIARLANEKAQKLISQDLAQALWQYQFTSGLNLEIDTEASSYITEGYEKNPDIFGITNKIARMFSRVKIKAFKTDKEDTEVDNPLEEYFVSDDIDTSFEEYLMVWELFNLIEGNGIDYIETVYMGGNNVGKIRSIDIIPPQNVEIKSGGWREPIKSYHLNFNQNIQLDKKKVYHTRMFPNLDYTNGKNFMGISPVKVAANIINAQNNGYARLATLLKKGAPPGILSKMIDGAYDPEQTEEQRKNMERQWKRKYGNPETSFLPLFTTGDVRWQGIGISSMKDLQVLESSIHGLRALCRVWGVPSQAFGDNEQSTYNNVSEAKKSVYEERIQPDMEMRLAVFNRILGNDYYKIRLEADYSDIPCLQEDRKKAAEILSIEKMNRAITTDEFREGMGRDPMDESQRTELGTDEDLLY